MGEYAIYKGERVKIGTCNEMYYLRWEQRHDVKPLSGNVDPVKEIQSIWFRAPRHSEDGIAPGMFDYQGWNGVRPIRLMIREDCQWFESEVRKISIASQGISQVVNKKLGVLCNVPCYHGFTGELPKGMSYNGFNSNLLGIAGVGIRDNEACALIGCLGCGSTFMRIGFKELVMNCKPFPGEEEDYELAIKQMMEMEAECITEAAKLALK